MTLIDVVGADEFMYLFCAPVMLDPICAACAVTGLLIVGCLHQIARARARACPALRLRQQRLRHEECQQSALAEPRATTTQRGTRWIVQRLAIDRASVSAVVKVLGLGWDLVNDLVISKILIVVAEQLGHLEGVRVLGVDEYKWKRRLG